jgi:YHS domain-containing protein
MKLMNQVGSCALAGVAALWLVGTAAAADNPMPSCCAGMMQTQVTNVSTNTTAKIKPDLLKTCPVSGAKLGEMGTGCTFTYKDQEVKLCCKACKAVFDKNPEKYIAKIRAADPK